MAEIYKINGRVTIGKGGGSRNIGAGTDVINITKEEAKKNGIKPDEFDKLAKRGVFTTGDGDMSATSKNTEPQPLSTVAFMKFSGAVEQLDKGEQKHWTSDNKPDIVALKEHGCTVTAAERDEAWALYNAD